MLFQASNHNVKKVGLCHRERNKKHPSLLLYLNLLAFLVYIPLSYSWKLFSKFTELESRRRAVQSQRGSSNGAKQHMKRHRTLMIIMAWCWQTVCLCHSRSIIFTTSTTPSSNLHFKNLTSSRYQIVLLHILNLKLSSMKCIVFLPSLQPP